MRTRLLRPDFWADDVMASLPPHVRLTFMGLWSLSDDDGYFDWKPHQIGAELYRYQSAATRERQIEAHLDRLIEAHRIEHLDCGEHGRIPSMERHRIQSGRHSFSLRDEHGKCASRRGIPRPSASRSDSLSVSVSESVAVSSRAPARRTLGSKEPDDEKAELLRKLEDPSTPPGILDAIRVRLGQIEAMPRHN